MSIESQPAQNLDVHAAMDIFQAWAWNGGERPSSKSGLGSVRPLLPKPFPPGEFGGKSENMKLARAVLNGLEWDDWRNLETILGRYAVLGHQGEEIFPASHDQINHASAGTALLVAHNRSMSTLEDLLVAWHQRQFHLCRRLDTAPLKDAKGRPVGPWGPGARADKAVYGNNGGRTLAYLTAQGQRPRAAQLADRSNTGALAITKMPVGLRAQLLETPNTLVLALKIHIGRRAGNERTDYVAWFEDVSADYVAVAGVWDGKSFASRTLGPDDREKIQSFSAVEVVG